MDLGLGLGGEDIVVRPAESWIQFQNMTSATKADLVQNTELFLRLGLELGSQRQNTANPNPPIQLDLLPAAPVPRGFSWHPNTKTYRAASENGNCEGDYGETRSCGQGGGAASASSPRGFDVNRVPSSADNDNEDDDDAAVSSPNSTISSFQMDFAICHATSAVKRERDGERDNNANDNELDRDCSRGSDEEEGGGTRKKLRLSKEQSAYLEESFKEHNTLNPKQKLALAKQLNLRPRQVEVWFQNRRARTKLKQTEVDCEYLKRCYETLTEENRRLQKDIQELRALKVAHPSFYMHLPATTLTMCPSCERIASASAPPDSNAKGLHGHGHGYGHGPTPWPTLASAHLRPIRPPPRLEQ
uniref:Homeobox domain-containing protein n=1 Tax=Picea sitchensis TaxID=3332 RepID=A9NV75_PICSI|nr:unknown [Picea sitchensis]